MGPDPPVPPAGQGITLTTRTGPGTRPGRWVGGPDTLPADVSPGRTRYRRSLCAEWARDNGYTVSNRGRIPKSVQEAFEAAHRASETPEHTGLVDATITS